MTVASDAEFFSAVVEALEDEGLLVGDGETPGGVQHDHAGRLLTAYVVAYPMPSGGTTGPLGDVHADEDFVVQVTGFGQSRQQAQLVSDAAKRRLMSGDIDIPGRTLASQVDLDVATGASRDDDTKAPPLWLAHHRYRFRTTPA